MIVYDCDETEQSAALESRMAARDLVGEKLLQVFGPDRLAEARNRGFDSR